MCVYRCACVYACVFTELSATWPQNVMIHMGTALTMQLRMCLRTDKAGRRSQYLVDTLRHSDQLRKHRYTYICTCMYVCMFVCADVCVLYVCLCVCVCRVWIYVSFIGGRQHVFNKFPLPDKEKAIAVNTIHIHMRIRIRVFTFTIKIAHTHTHSLGLS